MFLEGNRRRTAWAQDEVCKCTGDAADNSEECGNAPIMLQDIVGSAGGVAVTGGICRFGSRTEEIMCGIVGYNGARPVTDFLLDALELLEYRGYDSAGLATINA